MDRVASESDISPSDTFVDTIVATLASMKSGRRPSFPIEFKVRIAALACEPGISLSKLAWEHDLRSNMLFWWRRQYRAGELYAHVDSASTLLPVGLVEQNAENHMKFPKANYFGLNTI